MENATITQLKKAKKKADRVQILFIVSMLFVPVAAFLFFYVYINFNSFFMAFQRPVYDGSGTVKWGFDNFKMFFETMSSGAAETLNIPLALRNTLIFYCTHTFINLPLSLMMCYFIYKKLLFGKGFRAVIYLPNIITGTIFATLFKFMVNPGGPINNFLINLTGGEVDIFNEPGTAMWGMIIFVIYTGLGGNFVLLGGAMNSIDTSIIDAGKVDGVGPFRELVSIIIPSIWPTLGTMILLSSIGILGADGPLLLFTQGYNKTITLNFMIFRMSAGIGGSTDYEYASAVGLIMTIIGLPIVYLVTKLTKVTKDN